MDARAPTLEVIRAGSAVRLRRSSARRDPGEALAAKSLRGVLGIAEGQGAQYAADAAMAPTAADPTLTSRAASARQRPWEMPGFGDDDTDADDAPPADGDGAQDTEYQDAGSQELEPLEPGDAPRHHSEAARPGEFAETDALVARARRALDAYNDLQSEAGRNKMAVADPAYD